MGYHLVLKRYPSRRGDADASGARLVAAEVLASTKVTTTWNDEEVIPRENGG